MKKKPAVMIPEMKAIVAVPGPLKTSRAMIAVIISATTAARLISRNNLRRFASYISRTRLHNSHRNSQCYIIFNIIL